MVAESGRGRIIFVDKAGEVVGAFPLSLDRPDAHHDTRLVRVTPKDTFLVAHENDGVVREYDRRGAVLWTFDVPLFGRDRAPGHGLEAHGDQCFDCYCRLWLPNAITVNNDNLNETLRPTLDCPKLKSYNLKVYNRWGEQLWESSNKNEEWDAIYKGEPVQAGVYFWIVNWRGIVNGQLERFDDKGVLHVIH